MTPSFRSPMKTQDKLAMKLLSGEFKERDTIVVDGDNRKGERVFKRADGETNKEEQVLRV